MCVLLGNSASSLRTPQTDGLVSLRSSPNREMFVCRCFVSEERLEQRTEKPRLRLGPNADMQALFCRRVVRRREGGGRSEMGLWEMERQRVRLRPMMHGVEARRRTECGAGEARK